MLARHNFGYKRSHLAARAVLDPSQVTSSPGPKTSTDPVTVPSSTAPPSTTVAPSTTPAPSPSSSSSSSPTPTTPVSSPSPSPSSPSSPTPTVSSTPTSPLVNSPTSSASASGLVSSPVTASKSLFLTTQAVSGISYTPTSSLASSPTSTPSSSSGTNTGVIIGGVAGTLVGVAVLGLLLIWCMRRQRNRDFEDFDAQAFKRQSAILMDDPIEPHNPRPPTMIEQHNVSPALAAQSGHGGQNFFGSFGGYGQQPPYAAPERPQQAYVAHAVGPAGYDSPREPLARQPSNMGYADYDTPQHLARQPSNGAYLTRQPNLPTSPPRSLDPNAHYIDLSRSSISPYQAAQYADISRQLGATNPDDQVPQESDELSDDPLPSPFDDPVEANPVPSATSHPLPRPVYPMAQLHGNAAAIYQRPATHYEEGDAYGGI